MAKSLLIVESPTKAKTLQKYLGKEYDVRSTKGHVRDLPKNELGVDVDKDFQAKYVTIVGKAKVISELKKAAAGVPDIYLGPDPDREGEAIAWHIAESLGEKNHRFHRVLLTEITQKAIREALAKPVPLNRARFESQQARRILDRLVGYQLSPLLWQKVKAGLSAGRVQSVALRLLVDREKAILAFVPEEYWTMTACLAAKEPPRFAARLVKYRGKDIKPGNITAIENILADLEEAAFTVAGVEKKPQKRNPAPPFITSTLQMEANRRLRFSPQNTMRVAQRLYEGMTLGDEGPVGLITYMRTDSTRVSGEALEAVRSFIGGAFGEKFLPKSPHRYKSPKGAQEAHEAIRPTDVNRRPEDVKKFLKKDEFALYELIWRRFVASQMAQALFQLTTVDVEAADYLFRATATVMTFPGFTVLYQETSEEVEKEEKLPRLTQGENLELVDFDPQQHFTKPPPRYTEASLIKELEVQGIGRPSTYATILGNLQTRDYVLKIKTRLRPTELGMAVSDLLVDSFPDVMDPKFTAHLEENLDRIAEGEASWLEIMREFYGPFAQELKDAKGRMPAMRTLPSGFTCPKCGKELLIRWGRAGEFLGCSAYPECDFTQDVQRDAQGDLLPPSAPMEGHAGTPESKLGPTGLVCPDCGKELVVRRGRKGEFLGCSGYPKCRFTRDLVWGPDGKPILAEPGEQTGGAPCPQEGCDGHLVKRRSRRGIFYGCSRYPKCSFTLNQPPVEVPCPQCGFPWLRKKGKKLLCPKDACDYEESAPADAAVGG
jgi:DNA topoisomerase-1|uniref:DNA topoisomerase 1 n=1 Tax=Desulfobacca acetoxidans TaxID=60893 RepID=A0A7V6A399_9BACT